MTTTFIGITHDAKLVATFWGSVLGREVADGASTERASLVGLGATTLAEQRFGGGHWLTSADPEGNEFDLIEG